MLHGPYGEDGTLQGLLEMAGVRYVGAGVLASAVGMDKHYMKVVLRSAGLPVLPHVLVTPTGWESDPEACREAVLALGFPVFVKPCRGGSSVGISKVYDLDGLDAAIEAARAHDPRVLVEAYAGADARELECGVIGSERGKRPEVSVVAEIVVDGRPRVLRLRRQVPAGESTTLVVPADIDRGVSDQLRELAVRTFEAVGLRGPGPGRLLRPARRTSRGQRAEHDARLHPDLDVPAGVEGVRDRLPRARRPADRAGPVARHRPALIRADPGLIRPVATGRLRSRRVPALTAAARSTSAAGVVAGGRYCSGAP